MYIDGGRKLQAFGPCDEYGDHLPNGVARVRLVWRTGTGTHGIVLDYSEAVMLLEELQHATTEIEANRAAVQRKKCGA